MSLGFRAKPGAAAAGAVGGAMPRSPFAQNMDNLVSTIVVTSSATSQSSQFRRSATLSMSVHHQASACRTSSLQLQVASGEDAGKGCSTKPQRAPSVPTTLVSRISPPRVALVPLKESTLRESPRASLGKMSGGALNSVEFYSILEEK